MRKLSATLTAILTGALLVAAVPTFAATADESDFTTRINQERTSRGIKAVALDTHLSDIARRHSQEMASQNDLHHNDNLGNEVDGWEELDENVGEGRSVTDIHNAFMDSPTHRAGILGNYEKVGVGTVWKDGILWVTEVFFRAKHTSTTTVRRTTVRRTTTTRRTTIRRKVTVHTAARAVPVAPPKPVPTPPLPPVITSGKLEKLLGDLLIAGQAAVDLTPAPAASPGEARLASVLWQFVEAEAA